MAEGDDEAQFFDVGGGRLYARMADGDWIADDTGFRFVGRAAESPRYVTDTITTDINGYTSIRLRYPDVREEQPVSERPIEVTFSIDQTNGHREHTLKVRVRADAIPDSMRGRLGVGGANFALDFDNACLLRDELNCALTDIERVMAALKVLDEPETQPEPRGWRDL